MGYFLIIILGLVIFLFLKERGKEKQKLKIEKEIKQQKLKIEEEKRKTKEHYDKIVTFIKDPDINVFKITEKEVIEDPWKISFIKSFHDFIFLSDLPIPIPPVYPMIFHNFRPYSIDFHKDKYFLISESLINHLIAYRSIINNS
jgi:hypothetical protein